MIEGALGRKPGDADGSYPDDADGSDPDDADADADAFGFAIVSSSYLFNTSSMICNLQTLSFPVDVGDNSARFGTLPSCLTNSWRLLSVL
jgi:hypothetical protein